VGFVASVRARRLNGVRRRRCGIALASRFTRPMSPTTDIGATAAMDGSGDTDKRPECVASTTFKPFRQKA
jgi:hypothetical protein